MEACCTTEEKKSNKKTQGTNSTFNSVPSRTQNYTRKEAFSTQQTVIMYVKALLYTRIKLYIFISYVTVVHGCSYMMHTWIMYIICIYINIKSKRIKLNVYVDKSVKLRWRVDAIIYT